MKNGDYEAETILASELLISMLSPKPTHDPICLISVVSKQFMSIPRDLWFLLISFRKGDVTWCSNYGAHSIWHCIACQLNVNYTVVNTPVMSCVTGIRRYDGIGHIITATTTTRSDIIGYWIQYDHGDGKHRPYIEHTILTANIP